MSKKFLKTIELFKNFNLNFYLNTLRAVKNIYKVDQVPQ